MSCEVFNNSDIAFINETSQEFVVNLNMVDVENTLPYSPHLKNIEWKMSRYGESECLVLKDIKDGVSQNGCTITVSLLPNDTKDLFGKFSHQLILTDVLDKKFVFDLGRLTIKSIIK